MLPPEARKSASGEPAAVPPSYWFDAEFGVSLRDRETLYEGFR
jgi:hypothetical protein